MAQNTNYASNKSANTDRPAQMTKDFVQQGVDYSKTLADKSEAVADAAGKSMQQSYSAAVSEAANFNVQWIEMIRENTNASLDLARPAGPASPAAATASATSITMPRMCCWLTTMCTQIAMSPTWF